MKGCNLTTQDIELLAKLLKGVVIVGSKKEKQAKKNSWVCCKCGKNYYIHRHHVTYNPPVIKLLCRTCHALITSVNTKGSMVAGGNKETRVIYTNKLRWVLWRWFLKTKFPAGLKRVSKTMIREALRAEGFKIELRGL